LFVKLQKMVPTKTIKKGAKKDVVKGAGKKNVNIKMSAGYSSLVLYNRVKCGEESLPRNFRKYRPFFTSLNVMDAVGIARVKKGRIFLTSDFQEKIHRRAPAANRSDPPVPEISVSDGVVHAKSSPRVSENLPDNGSMRVGDDKYLISLGNGLANDCSQSEEQIQYLENGGIPKVPHPTRVQELCHTGAGGGCLSPIGFFPTCQSPTVNEIPSPNLVQRNSMFGITGVGGGDLSPIDQSCVIPYTDQSPTDYCTPSPNLVEQKSMVDNTGAGGDDLFPIGVTDDDGSTGPSQILILQDGGSCEGEKFTIYGTDDCSDETRYSFFGDSASYETTENTSYNTDPLPHSFSRYNS